MRTIFAATILAAAFAGCCNTVAPTTSSTSSSSSSSGAMACVPGQQIACACTGGYDIFLAKYDASGAGISSHHYGDASDEYALHLAVNASGTPILAGAFSGTLDAGSGPITAPNNLSVFVCQIAE